MNRRATLVLALIVAVAIGLRAAYLLHAVHTPGYSWEDPDGHVFQARRLAPPGESSERTRMNSKEFGGLV